MDVSLSDKFGDITKRIPNKACCSRRDVCVTVGGRVLRSSEELRSCGVRDGSTVQVMSRLLGGGRHKDKKSRQTEKTQSASSRRSDPLPAPQQVKDTEGPRSGKGPVIQECVKDAVIRLIEEKKEYRGIVGRMSERNEHRCGTGDARISGGSSGVFRIGQRTEEGCWWCGLRWAVEARRKREGAQRGSTPQDRSKAKKSPFRRRGAVRQDAMQAQSTDKQDENSGKGKGKGNGGKGEHGCKRGSDNKCARQNARQCEVDERVQVTPNVGLVAHTPRPRQTLKKKSGSAREDWHSEARDVEPRWADCVEEELGI